MRFRSTSSSTDSTSARTISFLNIHGEEASSWEGDALLISWLEVALDDCKGEKMKEIPRSSGLK